MAGYDTITEVRLMGDRPLLAITLGDPAGIGPEIVVKTLLNARSDAWDAVVIGAAGPLEAAAKVIGRPLTLQPVTTPAKARQLRGTNTVARSKRPLRISRGSSSDASTPATARRPWTSCAAPRSWPWPVRWTPS